MAPDQKTSLTNYCSYIDPETKAHRIGSLSEDRKRIQPLAFCSGTPINDLYEVIEAGEDRIIACDGTLEASLVKLLAPIDGRDVLCVGKNYAAHATEFNKSGYDSSDKVDQPTHPVIFTKRFTSIIADGDEISPHQGFTSTADYEGELGVIVDKAGFRISEENAMDYVWGYTICNDMTARERQRDHKQFYIGKSPDTYCPMGPVAIPKEKLEKVFRVQTRVNGELRQDATTEDLIFPVPYLIKTLSEGQTLMPGDVLATGTPAGVGFGLKPPKFLESGDEVAISITGLGTLTNRIAASTGKQSVKAVEQAASHIRPSNSEKVPGGNGLSTINGKPMHYIKSGIDGNSIVFVHGLGGSMEYWTPMIESASLRTSHTVHLYDFEGHGMSPTSPLSELTIESLAEDLKGVSEHGNITGGATLVAHSMGCLVAIQFAIKHPQLISRLVLLGPPPSPLPEAGSNGSHERAGLVRRKGMAGVANTVAMAGTSERTKRESPIAMSAVRLSLLGQDPEGYAKACSALAKSVNNQLDFSKLEAEVLLVTGSEDKISPPELCHKYEKQLKYCRGVTVLQDVGHWHNFEDILGVVKAVSSMI